MRVEQLLSRTAGRHPEKIALVTGNHRYSYKVIAERASAMANTLLDAGLLPQDRVAICLNNSVEAVVAIFAVLEAGGIFFVIDPQSRPERIAALLNDSQAFAVITANGGVVRRGQTPFDGPFALIHPVPVLPCHGDERDVAALIYTSGSTGVPKGVMLTHRNILAAAGSISAYLENTSADVILSVLPLSFTYGLGQLMTAFSVGATLVLERSFSYPRAILDTMARERVTGLPLVPTMATLLLQQDLSQDRFPKLRYITNAAAAMPISKVRRLRETFPNAQLYLMYGLTECQRVSYLPPHEADMNPGSVGLAIPGTEVYVVDEDGRRASPGVTGELVVRGPHVMKGYWNQPEATARALRPGMVPGETVLHTGDLFWMDQDGLLYFVDRMDDIIKTRGEKVAPRQIEEVIARLPGVAEVTAYGVIDEVLGEAIAVAIAPVAGALLDARIVQRHCRQHLDAYMVPKYVDIWDALPTTPSGKVHRRAVRVMANASRRTSA